MNYVNFTDNYALVSGSTLFWDLLDRCTVSPFAEVYKIHDDSNPEKMPENINGVAYFEMISRLNKSNFSGAFGSYPIHICFCRDSKPDCRFQVLPISVKRGETFTVTLVAVDQVDCPVNATIHSSLTSILGGLGEDPSSQNITDSCTDLTYTVFSPHKFETLTLYAEGPCKDSQLSQSKIDIHFQPCTCPIGFRPKNDEITNCVCECDYTLHESVLIVSDHHPQARICELLSIPARHVSSALVSATAAC